LNPVFGDEREGLVMRGRSESTTFKRYIAGVAVLCVLGGIPGCSRWSLGGFPRFSESQACDTDPSLPSSMSFLRKCRATVGAPTMWRPAWVQNVKACAAHGVGRINYCWYACQEKIQRKREEANAPPWPKFHSVPVEPAFTPRGDAMPVAPDAFGTFGPE
jgi:hypothetical protein